MIIPHAPGTAVPVTIRYTNYRGETSTRSVMPLRIWFGTNEWHREPQWLMDGIDLRRSVERSFALAAITGWKQE